MTLFLMYGISYDHGQNDSLTRSTTLFNFWDNY